MNNYSAIVEMELRIGDLIWPISHMGRDFLILQPTPVGHLPINAEIAVTIDGQQRCWQVYLPDGIRPDRKKTRIIREKE